MFNYFNTIIIVYDKNPAKSMQFCTKVVHGKSWRHRTRLVLTGGVRWHFPAPEVDAYMQEVIIPGQEKKAYHL